MVLLINSLHALKVALVEEDVVGVFREDGRHLLRQRVHLVVGLGREEVEEDLCDALQHVVGRHHGDGVVERRRLGIVGDELDEGVIHADAFKHGRLIVLEAYLVEGCRVVRRTVVLVKEWIISH